MAQLFTNNAATTLASGLAAGNTSLTVASGKGALFPSPVATNGDYSILTVVRASDGAVEVMKLTARSTDTFTVVRAQEGTSALDFLTGDKVELRITAGALSRWDSTPTMQNFAINGGCRVAQYGNSVAVSNNNVVYGGCDNIAVYPASFTTCTGTILQSSAQLTATTKAQSAAVTTTGTGSLYFRLCLEAKDARCLSGKTITFSFLACQNTGGDLSVYPSVYSANSEDVFTTVTLVGLGTAVSVGATMTRVTQTVTLSANQADNGLLFYMQFSGVGAVTSKTFSVGEVQIEIGPGRTEFQEPSYATTLAQCQRYYEVQGGVASTAPQMTGYQTAGSGMGYGVGFKVEKRVAPTMAIAGTWYVLNCAQPTVSAPSVGGYLIIAVATASSVTVFRPADATCVVTASAVFA